MEMLGSRQSTLHGTENLTYSLYVTIEEGMENFGVIYFVFALLTYLREECGEIRLKFD
jgi:hypothetical protein